MRMTTGSSTERGVALIASRLSPFLQSVAFRDQRLRSFAYFTPQSGHKAQIWPLVRTHRVWFQLGRAAQVMAMRTHISLWFIRIGTGFGLQAFLRDLLVPRALFSHFRSDLSLLNPKTLEQTNQGIEWNGKRLNS
ncbi:hypothetical protein PIB30_085518 [Stylosanthes scabra]|uniref:Uncharacterized protein n=1 Tax=Stylosanthes scabra TaxID=79078 RepID=A0ABU6VSP0_9FABA|nr:hypothetical protein [Stylosanthes scabra]